MEVRQKMSNIEISIVIPVYNSKDCLDELVRRLTDVLDNSGKTYEIVLVSQFGHLPVPKVDRSGSRH